METYALSEAALQGTIALLRNEAAHLRALLREVQWAADDDGAGCCPICREGYPVKRHAPECRLAQALSPP